MMNSVTKYLIWTTTRRSKYGCLYKDIDDDAHNTSIDWLFVDDIDGDAHYVVNAYWFCDQLLM